ncbi:MAG: SLBB domain-containing protein, partial [Verrucomicrobiota bacterium]|nr:SLBB domain-containing protein [Verrucomicrobiota bacterium]
MKIKAQNTRRSRCLTLTAKVLVCVLSGHLLAAEVDPANTKRLRVSTVDVTVAGNVRQPGSVRLPVGTTILDAIAAMGGASDFANLRRVQLIR